MAKEGNNKTEFYYIPYLTLAGLSVPQVHEKINSSPKKAYEASCKLRDMGADFSIMFIRKPWSLEDRRDYKEISLRDLEEAANGQLFLETLYEAPFVRRKKDLPNR
jgi:hypothetical protein